MIQTENKIQLLDESTANRIAAGEVVDRPRSIVKELVENSIDAGATSISVQIEAGGISNITVIDNGAGIGKDDLSLAFLRHATGKIKSGDSLSAIQTLGFRGEALSSIASVSKVHALSRLKGQELGEELLLEGGKTVRKGSCGCAEGTTISISELFYNTPARLKFLKSARAETAQISDIMAKLILCNPTISFRYVNNDNIVYQSPGKGLLDAIYSIYGQEVVDQLIPIDVTKGALRIHGFLGKTSIARKTRAAQTLIVDGRYVLIEKIASAVQTGYGQRLMIGRFPFFVLNIDLPLDQIDVNVHPQKTEIRFKDENNVQLAIQQAVHETLAPKFDVASIENKAIAKSGTTPSNKTDNKLQDTDIPSDQQLEELSYQMGYQRFFEKPKEAKETYMGASQRQPQIENTHNAYKTLESTQPTEIYHTVKEVTLEDTQTEIAPKQPFIDAKIIGQLFATYLLVQLNEYLYIIDQHAAHERLNYDRFMAEYENNNIAEQQLLSPEVIDITHSEMQLVMERQEAFKKVGISFDAFGPTSIAVRSVPAVLSEQMGIKAMFQDSMDMLSNHVDVTSSKLIEEQIIMRACKHSIRAGDSLDNVQMQALMQKLNENENLTCPHGRPIVIKLSKTDLEKSFKRIV